MCKELFVQADEKLQKLLVSADSSASASGGPQKGDSELNADEGEDGDSAPEDQIVVASASSSSAGNELDPSTANLPGIILLRVVIIVSTEQKTSEQLLPSYFVRLCFILQYQQCLECFYVFFLESFS